MTQEGGKNSLSGPTVEQKGEECSRSVFLFKDGKKEIEVMLQRGEVSRNCVVGKENKYAYIKGLPKSLPSKSLDGEKGTSHKDKTSSQKQGNDFGPLLKGE